MSASSQVRDGFDLPPNSTGQAGAAPAPAPAPHVVGAGAWGRGAGDPSTPPRIGALFAGYGGLDLAVERVLGGRTAWVAEVDKAPSAILARRFPDAPNLGDVTRIDWRAVEPVDVLTGGSPCQDLSHAGKRAGMRPGTRSGLWAAMCDAVEIIRPRYVVWENVRGALSARADSAVEPCPLCVGDDPGVSLRALGRVLGDLAEVGYDAAWCGVRASDVGAPHQRYRVFVLAWDASRPAGLGGAAVVPDADRATGGERGLAAPGEEEGGRARADAGGRGGAPAPIGLTLLPTPAVNDMGKAYTPDEWDAWTAKMKGAHGNGNGHGKSLEIEAARLLPTPEASDASGGRVSAELGGSRESGAKRAITLATALRHIDFGQYAPAIARWEAVLDRESPAPTEPTGKGGAHRLSPRFVEWMMGLPDGWVTDTDTTRNEQLKALGNGVVPRQAAAAVEHLLGVQRQVVAA